MPKALKSCAKSNKSPNLVTLYSIVLWLVRSPAFPFWNKSTKHTFHKSQQYESKWFLNRFQTLKGFSFLQFKIILFLQFKQLSFTADFILWERDLFDLLAFRPFGLSFSVLSSHSFDTGYRCKENVIWAEFKQMLCRNIAPMSWQHF